MLDTPHTVDLPLLMNNGMIRSEVRREDKDSNMRGNMQNTKIQLILVQFNLLVQL